MLRTISGGNDSRKWQEKCLILKIGTIYSHELNKQFSFIWSLHSFCPACADKSGDFSPFHSIVYVHPPPTYSLRTSASLADSKLFLHLIMHFYCFSHLIGLFYVTWLSLLYKFTQFFIYFLFLCDEGPTLDYTIRIGSTPTFLYFKINKYTVQIKNYCTLWDVLLLQ